MPLYEYECFLCHHRFERLQRVADQPVGECPKCGGQVRRLLGVPALQFKGSGWYVTDYGSKNSGRAEAPGPDAGNGSSAKEKPATDAGGDSSGSSPAKGGAEAKAAGSSSPPSSAKE